MTKKLLFLTLVLITSNIISSQECLTDSLNQKQEIFNNEISDFFSIEDTTYLPGHIRTKKIIPVIVHLFDDAGPYSWFNYYDEEQVTRTINELGRHFDGQDFASINGEGSGHFSNFKFCIADKSPQGNPIEGIRYYQWDTLPIANQFDVTDYPGDYYQQLHDQYAYNPINYCNIWVIAWDEGPKGFAFYPPNPKGPWIKAGFFGQTIDYYDSHTRVLEHEMGHYLGLAHTFYGWAGWPCESLPEIETDCRIQGDYVCDTPPTRVNYECINPECDLDEDVKNYMNYMSDGCVERFSLGQIQRMHDRTESGRPHLITDGSVCSTCPEENPCPYDFDHNGEIGASDILDLLVQFGNFVTCSEYDIDSDGYVGAQDILGILAAYGSECEDVTPWIFGGVRLTEIKDIVKINYIDPLTGRTIEFPKGGFYILEYKFINGLILRTKVHFKKINK